jgi:hypothetical protein
MVDGIASMEQTAEQVSWFRCTEKIAVQINDSINFRVTDPREKDGRTSYNAKKTVGKPEIFRRKRFNSQFYTWSSPSNMARLKSSQGAGRGLPEGPAA